MYDKLSVLQAEVTKTASFNGSGYDLTAGGYPNERLMARVLYNSAANASGSGVVTFSIEHSDDNVAFVALASGAADKITLTTTDQDGEIFIPVTTNKRYIRLVCTIAGGTTPTITYSGDIGTAAP